VANNELIAVQRDIIATVASPGWYTIQQFAEAVVQDKERAAIDEEDDVKGNALRREAKAARSFMKELFARIEKAKYSEAAADQMFMSVVYEQGFEEIFN
jgi:hypothetical protein